MSPAERMCNPRGLRAGWVSSWGVSLTPEAGENGAETRDFGSLRNGNFYNELYLNKEIELLLDSSSGTLVPDFITSSVGKYLPGDSDPYRSPICLPGVRWPPVPTLQNVCTSSPWFTCAKLAWVRTGMKGRLKKPCDGGGGDLVHCRNDPNELTELL